MPRYRVCYFQVLQFQIMYFHALQVCASLSSLAFSYHAIWSVNFRSCIFSSRDPATSVEALEGTRRVDASAGKWPAGPRPLLTCWAIYCGCLTRAPVMYVYMIVRGHWC